MHLPESQALSRGGAPRKSDGERVLAEEMGKGMLTCQGNGHF